MEAIFSLLAPFWGYIAAAGGVLVGVLSVYMKGRRDVRKKIEAESLRESSRRTKDALDADARVSADINAGKLREDDGFRRD